MRKILKLFEQKYINEYISSRGITHKMHAQNTICNYYVISAKHNICNLIMQDEFTPVTQ